MKKNEGFVVVLSLVVATVLALLLSIFWGSIVAERRNVERSYRSLQALNLAEAGVEKAVWELNNDFSSAIAGDDKKITIEGVGECMYTTTISGDEAIIQASGYSPGIAIPGHVTRKVKVTADSHKLSLFDYLLFADSGPIVLNDSYVDSYNSTLGSYEDQAVNKDEASGYTNANSGALVGTNSADPNSIQLDDSSMIFGEVVLSANAELVQPATPASFDYSYDGISVSGNNVFRIDNPGTYWVGSISVSGNGVLEINAPVTIYVAGDVRVNDLDITGNGEIRIATGCTAEFYVEGNMKVAGNGVVNQNEDPSALRIYGTQNTSNIMIQGNAAFCGVVYAPWAHVQIKGAKDEESAVLYGAVVANSIEIGPHGKIHYDEALQNNSDFSPSWASRYEVTSWEEK